MSGHTPGEFKGRIAFWPIIRSDEAETSVGGPKPYGIGVAEENEPGYRPYTGLEFATREDAAAAAKEMNARLGLSEREAALIVGSSMRSDHYERKRYRAAVAKVGR